MNENRNIKLKLYAVYLAFCLLGVAVLVCIVNIQMVEGTQWREKAQNLTTKYREIQAIRGNVYSSDGSLMATSIPIYEIRMDVNADALTDEIFYAALDSLSWSLSNLFKDKSAAAYKSELTAARKSKQRYYLVRRNVDYNEMIASKSFPLFRKGRYKGGVIYEKRSVRVKPFGILAERTIGRESREGSSFGLEGAYADILAGTRGLRLEKRLAGNVWMPLEGSRQIEPEDGLDLISSIDINIQDVAENALMKQLQLHHADHGCVVLMEVKTGKIRAIANLQRNSDESYSERYNYAVGESTEPGSTFKLMAMLAALDDGTVTIEDTVDAGNGVHRYYDIPMHDSKEGGYGKISLQRAFEVSSNIGISKTISKHYKKDPERFINKLTTMGLNNPLGVELPGEGRPKIKGPKDNKFWSGISLTQISIGYEVSLTPLQILAFYNAVANDGKLVRPSLAEGLAKNGKWKEKFEPVILNEKIASSKAIEQARTMLEGVVERGTAQNLKNAYFNIAGKTGTARLATSKKGYGDSQFSYQASFCGYFPADEPLYSCIVVVNAPSKSVYYGNLVAGPIFREIADKVYATSTYYHDAINTEGKEKKLSNPVATNGYFKELKEVYSSLEIPFSEREQHDFWVRTSTQKDTVKIYNLKSTRPGSNMVPNVVGLGLKDALYLLENSGLHVEVEGFGTVKRQNKTPGTRIEQNAKIKIELS